jgi:hypothetical protein
MTRRKWSVLAVSAAAAASVICAGATALAAAGHGSGSGSGSHAMHSNYRGPARTAHVVPSRHQSNYKGPARRQAAVVVHGSNRPSSARHHARTQGGNR